MPEQQQEQQDPKVWFDLFILNEDSSQYVKSAQLFDPVFADMFWYSYRVEPISEEADRALRDEKIWDHVAYVVQLPNHEPPKVGSETGPLAGGWDFKQFCARKTNRISFRSLSPFEEKDVLTLAGCLLGVLTLPFTIPYHLLRILLIPDKQQAEAKKILSQRNKEGRG